MKCSRNLWHVTLVAGLLCIVVAACPSSPRLNITPLGGTFGPAAGTTTFTVSNVGSGQMEWSVAVTQGQDWLSISSGQTGGNNGVVTVAFTANAAAESRTGAITITAPGAAGSPASVTVQQDGAWAPDQFTCDVQFAPDTVLVDKDHVDLLVDSDKENHVYTFDAAGVQSSGLDFAVGKPLFIYGVAARRISSVRTEGEHLVVETDYAPLTEVITEGTIAWDYGVEFTPERIQSVEVPGKGIIYTKDGTPIEFSLEIGEYTYEIKASLDKEVSAIEFTVTKGLAGAASAKFVSKGEIKRFRSKDNILIEGGKLRKFDHDVNGMRGELTLELVVAASGQDFINLELPATIMRIPFLVGGIPVELDIKAQFVINASVPADGSSRVTTKFTYDSNLRFSCDGVHVTAGGSLGSMSFGDDDTHETGASSFISANFGLGFPRVSLNILEESVVLWAQTACLIGGSYTVYPACQTADVEFLGAAGYNLGFFGLDLLSGSVKFFDEKKKLLRAGDCPEESKSEELLDTETFLLP
jgi:hypothetical protein